jgi:hypothetical protein
MSHQNLRVFVRVVEKLSAVLLEAFPEDISLSLYNAALMGFLKVNPEGVCKYTLQYMTPIRDRIMAKDETLWSHNNTLEELDLTNENLVEAMRLRDLWGDMDEHTRQEVWTGLQNITRAAERVYPNGVSS